MNNLVKTLSVFYSFIIRKKYLFIIFVLVKIVSASLGSSIPYFFKLFIDNLEKLNYEALLPILFIFIFVRMSSLLTNSLAFYIGDIVTFDVAIAARKKIFKHLQDLDFAFHTEKSTGSLISAMKRGDGALWSFYHVIHHRFLSILVSFIVMTIFLSGIDFRIMFVVIVSFILALFITRYLVEINISARRRHNKEEDVVSGIIVDNLVNFETVKLFSRENWELDRLKKAYVPWLKTGWQYVNTFRLIDLSVGSLINLSILLILLLGLNLARNTSLSVGEFVLVLSFVNSFYPRLFDMVYGFREVGKNYTDVEKYFSLLENEIQIEDPKKPVKLKTIKGEIKFSDVFFSYKEGKEDALSGLNLRVRQGQSVALVGRSGAGKTTVVKLLMRFYDVGSGKITLDDHNINSFTKSKLRSYMGVVPQEPVLFNNTVGYNIAYAKQSLKKREILAAAKLANIHAFVESLPKKYETQVGERGVKLSGGQKQRLAIARMVLSDPEIVIFDEATSQLDSENEKLIQDAFWKVVENKTTIIIAHRLSTAMRADKIVVMEKGKIVESGSHKALLRKKGGLYRHFWNLQLNPNQHRT